MLPQTGHRLRLYIGESDKHRGKPLYEWILHKAKEDGLAGCTVLRAIAGFGVHSRIHSAKILDLSVDLPIIIEVIDSPDKIENFVTAIEAEIVGGALATIENIDIRFYGSKSP